MRAVAALALIALWLGGAGSTAAASPNAKRYTVTAAYTGSYEEHWSRVYAAPAYGSEWRDWAESASYVGGSTRPFTIRRSTDGRRFAFAAPLRLSASAVGSGLRGFYGDFSGDDTSDPQSCLMTDGMWSSSGTGMRGLIAMGFGDRRLSAGASADNPDFLQYALDWRCSPSGWTWSNHFTSSWGSTTPGWQVDASRLRKRFGRAFTITSVFNYDVGVDSSLAPNHNRLVLRFSPVGREAEDEAEPDRERWQVEVIGRDRWSWGMYTTLGAGVNVKWAHRTTLEIEDGKLVAATGKVRILDVTPFSDVEGALVVTKPRATAPGPYVVPKRSKNGNRVTLGLLKEGSSQYRVDFSVRAGPRLLETLRDLGVPDPQARYDAMIARGAVPNTAVPLVPADPRVVVTLQRRTYPRETDAYNASLPCTAFGGDQAECSLVKGAELVTVRPG